MKFKFLIFILLLFFSSIIYGNENKPSLELSIDIGCGLYVGSFLDHLQTDGAYTATPILDAYFSTYFTNYLGLQIQIGAGSVIHPLSEPMEGVILYLGVGPFYKLQLDNFFLKVWADFGYQHPTMTLQWYGSGFTEIGLGGGIDIGNKNSLFLSAKYRFQFLQSIIIYQKYASIDKNDNLSSISITIGWQTRW